MEIYIDSESIFDRIAEMTMPGNNDYQLGYNDCLDEIEEIVEHSYKLTKCGNCTSYCKKEQTCNRYGGFWKEDDFCSKGRPNS